MVQRIGMLAAGLGALFVGGLLGGALASLFLRPDAPVPLAGLEPAAAARDDSAIVRALEVLTEEVRHLQVRRETSAPADRAPVGPTHPANGGSVDLLAAIDRLSQALARAPARIAGASEKPPLVAPAGSGYRQSLANAMEGRDCEELSRELRFLTYQQVLERFGAPDEARNDGSFGYVVQGAGGEEVEVTFKFVDGYLFNVYY